MNIYSLIGLTILILVVANGLDLVPAIQRLANNLSNIPQLDSTTSRNPSLYSLAVHMVWLIAIVGVIRVLVSRPKDDD